MMIYLEDTRYSMNWLYWRSQLRHPFCYYPTKFDYANKFTECESLIVHPSHQVADHRQNATKDDVLLSSTRGLGYSNISMSKSMLVNKTPDWVIEHPLNNQKPC